MASVFVNEFDSGELSEVSLAAASYGVVTQVTSGLSGPTGLTFNNTVGAAPKAYVTESGSGELSIVDLSNSPSFGQTYLWFSGFNSPFDVATPLRWPMLYLTEFNSNEILRIDRSGGARIVLATGLSSPAGLALSKDDASLYVTEAGSGELLLVDTVNGNVFPVAFGFGQPRGIALGCHGLSDADEDGIPDVVEIGGVRDRNGILAADIAALGADPCRKTVAVEIDYMDGASDGHSHKPKPAAVAEVVDAFNKAPVQATLPCPFGGYPTRSNGVNLLVVVDDPIPETPEMSFGTGFETTKMANFDNALRPYFRYSLWVHNLGGGRGSTSGTAELFGNDFIVSLGSWTNQEGTVREQAGTFMHELGHNLGLEHGGRSGVNCKPNYLSVMNYLFQFGIVDADSGTSTIDYSRVPLPQLFESNLDENLGISDGAFVTAWSPDGGATIRAGRGDGPLDWTGSDADANGVVDDDTGVSVNINNLGFPGCAGSGNVLVGHDDWASLDYVFTDDLNYIDGVHRIPLGDPEISSDDARIVQEFWASLPPGSQPTGGPFDDGWLLALILGMVLLFALGWIVFKMLPRQR